MLRRIWCELAHTAISKTRANREELTRSKEREDLMMPVSAEPFIAARDLLLRLRDDYDAAVQEVRWPVMDRFNWALDYFDHLPAYDLALWCIGETEEKLSF